MRQPICVVHTLVPGQSFEHGLAKLRDQHVAAILSRFSNGESRSRQFDQPKRIIEFAKGQQTGVVQGAEP
ncbi:hypothetical protein GCM10007937_40280 [Mesorhizobium albiziae]|nr:hypothetical protein GCM10007937_40280 [Mesorhizobium albiziae]